MRLAKKYMASELFQKLALLLERDWPRDFTEWKRMQRLLEDRRQDFKGKEQQKDTDANTMLLEITQKTVFGPVICSRYMYGSKSKLRRS